MEIKLNSFAKIILIIAIGVFIVFVVRNLITTSGPKFTSESTNTNNSNQVVKDIEGNVYKTVTIGSQVWMAENLRTTTYNDGEPIKQINYRFWSTTNEGAYCWVDDDIRYKPSFGGMYNWYAVESQKLCPPGWHIPDSAEFATLINFLGGKNIAGSKMKEAGFAHWRHPNKDATNSSGFSALPSDYSKSNAPFRAWRGSTARFWSSTESTSSNAWDIELNYDSSTVERYNYPKNNCFSIHCIKD
jgi:uncharacterized protein (TIGR02145 family)